MGQKMAANPKGTPPPIDPPISPFNDIMGNESKPQNLPTDEGFKIFIKTQFGDDITVYGLTEDSTMLDIQRKLEVRHGSAMSKSGIYIAPPHGIDHDLWSFNSQKDMKLKDLGIKANDTVVWSTVYTKYKSTLADEVSQDVRDWGAHKETSYQHKISLDKVLSGDKDELTLFGTLLKKRGWCLVTYPELLKQMMDSVCKMVHEGIKTQGDHKSNEEEKEKTEEWKQLWDGYGFINFDDYKKVLRVVTGSVMNKYKNEYPASLADALGQFCVVLDKVSVGIINVIAANENVFQFKSVKAFEAKCKETDCNVTILSGHKTNEEVRCSLLDFVLYENLDAKKENSKYPMIKDQSENVAAHTDPGLFSLSFLSTAAGLQMYDVTHDCWRAIEEDCGVFWCGEAAPTISDGKILAGIHRVVFNGDHPRFTGWYECSVDTQLTNAVLK